MAPLPPPAAEPSPAAVPPPAAPPTTPAFPLVSYSPYLLCERGPSDMPSAVRAAQLSLTPVALLTLNHPITVGVMPDRQQLDEYPDAGDDHADVDRAQSNRNQRLQCPFPIIASIEVMDPKEAKQHPKKDEHSAACFCIHPSLTRGSTGEPKRPPRCRAYIVFAVRRDLRRCWTRLRTHCTQARGQ